MKVVIVYTWARDGVNAAVRADGAVDWRGARMTAGEDDPAALAVAKQLAEGSGGTVVGLTIGDGDASWALARGVGETFSVTDVPPLSDNAATARIIAAAVERIGDVDVVVIGDSKQDPGVAPTVAGHLGWTALAGLVSASVVDGRVAAVRRSAAEQRTIGAPPPLVLGVAAEADVDTKPGMKELLAARKRPLTTWSMADLGLAVADVRSTGTRRPDAVVATLFEGDPATSAAQLVAALRADGVL
jgi:electron transfer flavoprotein beta subunit